MTSPARASFRIWSYRLGAAIAGLVLALLLCECGLRLVVGFELIHGPNTFTSFMKDARAFPDKEPLYRKSKDPELGYEYVPNTRRGRIRINSDGFRGQEYARGPTPGVKRIAFIGDSETFGARLAEHETLPGAVQELLNADGNGTVFEALNFGVVGYNTAQEWKLLRTRVMPFRPDAVVLYYVLNDPEIRTKTMLVERTLLSRSYLYMFAVWMTHYRKAQVSQLKRQYRSIIDYYKALHRSEYFEACKTMLRDMGDYLHARGIPFVVVIAPEIYGYNDFDAYPYHEIHAELAGLGSDHIAVIDPLPGLASMGRTPRSLWVTDSDPHKNAAATRVIAERVAQHLRAALGREQVP